MASTSETGHAKNIANLETLISFYTAYGTTYNPTKATLKLAALSTLLTNTKAANTSVNAAIPTLKLAIDAREIVFAPLSKLVTRVLNAVEISNVPKQVIDDVKTIARKLQGKRASKVIPKAVEI